MPVSVVLVECGPVSGSSVYCGVEMRLKIITILVSVLKSLHIPFRIVGISYTPGFMDSEANKSTLTAVNAAANINVQVKE